MELVKGCVESIKYQNEETGYTICDIMSGNEYITLVGDMPFLSVGEEVSAEGEYVIHKEFGRQFKVSYCEKRLPSTVSAIQKYLASGLISGIGEVTAARITDMFGADTLNVIDEHPEKLTAIKGITSEKAQKISECFKEQFGIRGLLIFLQGYGISPTFSIKIWKRFGSGAADIIKENPYILSKEIKGISFSKCDEIAKALEIPSDSHYRIKAGILYILGHNLQNGHTFIPYEKLAETACRFLGIELDTAEYYIDKLQDENEIVCDGIGSFDAVFLKKLYDCEYYIAERLLYMSNTLDSDENISLLIDEIEKNNNIVYEPLQKKAIEDAYKNRLFILTGGPGTGKTTILRAVIDIFEQKKIKYALAAPTGRAAKRMEELCKRESKTIHRLLEIGFGNDDGPEVCGRNEKNYIEADAVIIDESSMVDVLLAQALLKAMKPSCKLILVGDADQLSSVGAGNFLRDIIGSGKLPFIRLDKIFRQAKMSDIVTSAHEINSGIMPKSGDKNSDFFIMKQKSPEALTETVVSLYSERLPNAYNYNPAEDIEVICLTKKGINGTVALNKLLRDKINPASLSKPEIKFADTVFRLGDKVMQIKNDYDIIWTADTGETGMGVYNGDIGFVTSIDRREETLTVNFDGRSAVYTFSGLEELELAYAVTVHKSQGSEFEAVIIPAFDCSERLLYRSLLYTGVTRAKKLLVLAGSTEKINRMVENNRTQGRYTGLKYILLGIGDF